MWSVCERFIIESSTLLGPGATDPPSNSTTTLAASKQFVESVVESVLESVFAHGHGHAISSCGQTTEQTPDLLACETNSSRCSGGAAAGGGQHQSPPGGDHSCTPEDMRNFVIKKMFSHSHEEGLPQDPVIDEIDGTAASVEKNSILHEEDHVDSTSTDEVAARETEGRRPSVSHAEDARTPTSPWSHAATLGWSEFGMSAGRKSAPARIETTPSPVPEDGVLVLKNPGGYYHPRPRRISYDPRRDAATKPNVMDGTAEPTGVEDTYRAQDTYRQGRTSEWENNPLQRGRSESLMGGSRYREERRRELMGFRAQSSPVQYSSEERSAVLLKLRQSLPFSTKDAESLVRGDATTSLPSLHTTIGDSSSSSGARPAPSP